MAVAEGDAADVDRAVKAARKAFDEGPWPRMSGRERGKIIMRFAELMEQEFEKLCLLETLDNGKPLAISRRDDVPHTIDHFRYYAGWADKIHGETLRPGGDNMAYTLIEPIGVVGCIIPWNFPMAMLAWKLAPALAAGCTTVLKPAEQTPLTALRAAELALEAGLPPGVLNVVPGYGPTAGAALAMHPDVDKVGFTGSTEVGKLVMQMAAGTLKDVSLELGGKSPVVVDRSFDVDEAVELAHLALFYNHGQCCNAGSRLYVHDDIYDEFVEKATAKAAARVVGDPFKDGVDQGPQVDSDQFQKILGYIESGKKQGAKLMCGGAQVGDRGYYVAPTVFSDVQQDMKIAREEIFGPVQSIMRWNDVDEVTRAANDTNYGLAAGVFSRDLDLVNRLTRNIRAGTVWVNMYSEFDHELPFGGYKMSGIGRDKGPAAIKNYTQIKTVVMPLVGSNWK